jgi:hypothetical protein
LSTWFKNRLIKDQRYKNPDQVMQRYILPSARNGTRSKMDRVINIRDHELRDKAIAWRLNQSFQRKMCPVCNTVWDRSHIQGCFDDEGTWQTQLEEDIKKLKDEEILIRTTTNRRTIPLRNYNYLDFLLNCGAFSTFGHIYDHIKEQINNDHARRL